MWIVCTFKPVLSCIVNYWDHLQCWSDILAPSPLLSEGGGGSEGEGDFSPLCTFVWIHVDWLQACSVISPTCFVIFLYCQLLGSPTMQCGANILAPPRSSQREEDDQKERENLFSTFLFQQNSHFACTSRPVCIFGFCLLLYCSTANCFNHLQESEGEGGRLFFAVHFHVDSQTICLYPHWLHLSCHISLLLTRQNWMKRREMEKRRRY